MMADKNIVSGIFGMTPEAFSMQRDLAGQQLAATTAAQPGTLMSPSLAPFYAQAAQQGQLLGKVTGGLLGIEDPELAKIRDVQAMSKQFDTTSPSGLRTFARALAERGYTDLAMQASAKADAGAKALLDQNKTAEETRILGREIKEIGVEGNPELVIKAAVDKDGRVINTIGQPYSRFSQKTTINNQGPKNVLAIDEKDAEDYLKRFKAAEGMLPVLDRMDNLIQSKVLQGPTANLRSNVLSVFNEIGLNTDKATKALGNSEQYNKEVATLAEKTLKIYGTNPSNVDVKANLAKIPQLLNSPEGAAQMLKVLTTATREEYNESRRALDYYRNKQGSFAGFERKVPLLAQENTSKKITLPAGKTLDQLTAAEITALLAKTEK